MDMHTPRIERHSGRDRLAAVARATLMRVFQSYAGSIRVRLWDGTAIALGRGAPNVTVAFSDQRAFRSLVLSGDPLGLAEHFFKGAVDVEGDLDDLLAQRLHLRSLVVPAPERLKLLLHALFLGSGLRSAATHAPDAVTRNRSHFLHRHTKKADRAAIAFHYDVSNEFYRVWLDEQLVYPTLVADLEGAKVPFAGQLQNKWLPTLLSWIVPALIFVALWSSLIKRMSGGHGMGSMGGIIGREKP
jgi:hypothetical protein